MFWFNCHCEFCPLGGTIIKESVICLITPIYFIAHSKTLHLRFHTIVLNLWYRPPPFPPTFFNFFANLRNVTNLLFQTPPRRFHRFARNFAHSICGPSSPKVLKKEVLDISKLVCPTDMKLRLLLPHETPRHCAKVCQINTRWHSLNPSPASYMPKHEWH